MTLKQQENPYVLKMLNSIFILMSKQDEDQVIEYCINGGYFFLYTTGTRKREDAGTYYPIILTHNTREPRKSINRWVPDSTLN